MASNSSTRAEYQAELDRTSHREAGWDRLTGVRPSLQKAMPVISRGNVVPGRRTIAVSALHLGNMQSCKLFTIEAATGRQRELYSIDGYIGRPLWTRKGDAILVMLDDRILRRGQMWTVSFPDGQKRQRITNDLSDYDISIDMTRDGKQAAVVVKCEFIPSLGSVHELIFKDSADHYC